MFLLYSKMKREMKNFLLKWKKPLLWLTGFVLLVLCWQVWDGLFDAGLVLAAIVPGMSGGKIVVNEPLTTDIVREGSPSLLRSEVDKRIVKIRPMSTPIDQLSRFAEGFVDDCRLLFGRCETYQVIYEGLVCGSRGIDR